MNNPNISDEIILIALVESILSQKVDLIKTELESSIYKLKNKKKSDPLSDPLFSSKVKEAFDGFKQEIFLSLSNINKEDIDRIKLKFSDLTEQERLSLKGKDGLDGKNGKDGRDGSDGKDGRDVSIYDIRKVINKNIDQLKLKFSDLTEQEKLSLKGKDGLDGKNGKDGKDFIFLEHEELISSIIEECFDSKKNEILEKIKQENKDQFKLKFSDLSSADKNELIGPRGPRGLKGQKGKSFDFNDNKKEIDFIIRNHIDNVRPLLIPKLTKPELESLKLKFSDLNESEIDKLKLKFSDLTEQERLSLKGKDGLDGKNGKRGLKGDKGPVGLMGPVGPIGPTGFKGRDGRDGVDGKDAPCLHSVKIEKQNGKIRFAFYLSNDSILRTNFVEFEHFKNKFSPVMSAFGGGGGNGSTASLKFYEELDLISSDGGLNFNSKFFDVFSQDGITTASLSESKIDKFTSIQGLTEDQAITNKIRGISFEGDMVEATVSTTMADWLTLSEVDFIGTYEVDNPGYMRVVVSRSFGQLSDYVEKEDVVSNDSSADVDYFNHEIEGLVLGDYCVDVDFIYSHTSTSSKLNFYLKSGGLDIGKRSAIVVPVDDALSENKYLGSMKKIIKNFSGNLVVNFGFCLSDNVGEGAIHEATMTVVRFK